MKFSKILIIFMVIVMALTTFSACGDKINDKNDVSSTVSSVTSSNNSSNINSNVTSSQQTSNIDNIPAEYIATVGGSGKIYKFNDDIYKLDMPPVTSIFFIKNQDDWYIVDACKETGDIAKFLQPAAEKLSINLDNVKGILLTHNHWDHVDGLPALAPLCENAIIYAKTGSFKDVDSSKIQIVSGGINIDNLFKVVDIAGHAPDAIGFIDTRTNTLFSGDAIQLYGVSTAGILIYGGVDKYLESLENLKEEDIENILASHPYVPNGAFAVGKDQSFKHIEDSIDCMKELIEFTSEKYYEGMTDATLIKDAFIRKKKTEVKDFPTAGFVEAIKSIIDFYLK